MSSLYKPAILAYVDILGYRNFVLGTDDQAAFERINLLESLVKDCIHEQIAWFNRDKEPDDYKLKIEYELFSDSLVIWCDAVEKLNEDYYSIEEENYLRMCILILLLCDIQWRSVEHGFFFRGAISTGMHYKSNSVLFSKALVRAYEAESNLAVYPRIIIPPDAIDSVFNPSRLFKGLFYEGTIQFDADIVFIDILAWPRAVQPTFQISKSGFAAAHRDYILKNLVDNQGNERVLSKYRWLAEYHNFTFAQRFPLLGISIDWDNLFHPPKLEYRNEMRQKGNTFHISNYSVLIRDQYNELAFLERGWDDDSYVKVL